MKIKNKIVKIKKIQKIPARKFCVDFIAKHHEMIGNRSSYDKMKKSVDENKKYIFVTKNPQENSVNFSLLNIMK